jgi:hypothetical protein
MLQRRLQEAKSSILNPLREVCGRGVGLSAIFEFRSCVGTAGLLVPATQKALDHSCLACVPARFSKRLSTSASHSRASRACWCFRRGPCAGPSWMQPRVT